MTGFNVLNPYIACLGPLRGGSTGLPENQALMKYVSHVRLPRNSADG